MATLQRIRNHGVFLLIAVGVAMLAFVLGDLLNSGSTILNSNREYIGEIEGEKIHYTDYESGVQQLTEVYKLESGRSDFDEDMHAQIRNQVWQVLVAKHTLGKQAKKIGMTVTEDEKTALITGEHPHQLITQRRFFMGEDGRFNPDIAYQYFLHANDEELDPSLRSYLLYWENIIKLTALQEKYVGLLQSMLTANNIDAKYAASARETKANVDYAMKPYYTVADSLVSISNNDIKKIYEERKELFKQTPNRDIAYVSFPIVPSEQDYEDVEREMRDAEEEFRTTDEVAAVVNSQSDLMYDGRDLSEAQVPEAYKEFAFNAKAKAGDFMPLVYDDATRTFRMARIIANGYSTSDSVKLKAIATEEGQEDQDFEWFAVNDLPKDISEPALACKVGNRFDVDRGDSKMTLELTGISKPTPKVKLAIIEREVTPSSKTYSAIYNSAKQFVFSCKNEEAFRDSAEAKGMQVLSANIQKTTNKVADLKSSREIVRWAFEVKEGEVSDVYECGKEYIAAAVSAVHEGDYRAFEDVKASLRIEALNRKKAEHIMAELKGVASLQEAAEKMGTEVKHVEDLTKDSYRFGYEGMEPAAVGAAFATAAGELSAPVKGNQGVIVLVPSAVQQAEKEVNYASEIANLNARMSYSLPYQLMNNIEKNADITDNRILFQ